MSTVDGRAGHTVAVVDWHLVDDGIRFLHDRGGYSVVYMEAEMAMDMARAILARWPHTHRWYIENRHETTKEPKRVRCSSRPLCRETFVLPAHSDRRPPDERTPLVAEGPA